MYKSYQKSPSIEKLPMRDPVFKTMKESTKEEKNQRIVYNEYTDTEISNLDDVQKLKKLFLIYTNNEKTLASQKFLRLLMDAQIIDRNFDIRYADILFITENKNKLMDFQSFCDILVKISEIKFPSDYLNDENKCLKRLLNKYFFPLLNKVITPSKQFFVEEKIHRISFDNKIKDTIEFNNLLFKSLYEKYFSWESLNISNSQKKELSFKGFEKFLCEFEICPNLISRNKAYELFEETFTIGKTISALFPEQKWNSLRLGTSFTCLYFIIMLYLIAISSYFHDEKNKMDEYECFSMIIEKIYTSPGLKVLPNYHDLYKNSKVFFLNSEKALKKSYSTRLSGTLDNKKSVNKEENKDGITNKPDIYESKDNIINYPSNPRSVRSIELSPKNINYYKSNNEDNWEIDSKFIDKHKNVLLTIYKYYCNITNCTNQIFLNYSSFVRLMKDCNVIENKEKETTSNTSVSAKSSIRTSNKNQLSEQIKKNVISYNQINLLFSKFSSENDKSINDNLNSKKNYMFFHTSYSKFKTSSISVNKDPIKGFTNKKICFNGFMKILICISNKLFSPDLKENTTRSNKTGKVNPINIENLLEIEPLYMYIYLENFISLYLVPIYTDVKTVFDNEFNNFQLLDQIINDENIVLFISKFNNLLQRIFNIITDDKKYMFFEEYLKFCKEFEFFPDYIQKNRIYALFIHFVDHFDSLIIQGNPNFSIEYEKFVGLLLFCSIDSNIGGVNNYMEKVILFFEKLLQSEGMKRCTKLSGNGRLTYDFNNILVQFKSLYNKPKAQISKHKSFKELITKN